MFKNDFAIILLTLGLIIFSNLVSAIIISLIIKCNNKKILNEYKDHLVQSGYLKKE